MGEIGPLLHQSLKPLAVFTRQGIGLLLLVTGVAYAFVRCRNRKQLVKESIYAKQGAR